MTPTPKEKATEIFGIIYAKLKYHSCYVKDPDCSIDFEETRIVAKDLSIVSVKEIMEANPFSPDNGQYHELTSDRLDDVKQYWEQVLKCLEEM